MIEKLTKRNLPRKHSNYINNCDQDKLGQKTNQTFFGRTVCDQKMFGQKKVVKICDQEQLGRPSLKKSCDQEFFGRSHNSTKDFLVTNFDHLFLTKHCLVTHCATKESLVGVTKLKRPVPSRPPTTSSVRRLLR